MAIVRWRPLRDLYRLQEDMDRFIDDFFHGFPGREVETGMWSPSVDICETEDAVIVTAEVPGMKKDDIKISIQDNVLMLKGEKHQEKEAKQENYHRLERVYGSFRRSFSLPASVDASKVKASYKDGVLRIELPKKEEARPKEIPITVQ